MKQFSLLVIAVFASLNLASCSEDSVTAQIDKTCTKNSTKCIQGKRFSCVQRGDNIYRWEKAEDCPEGCDEEKNVCISSDTEKKCDTEGVSECFNGGLRTCENKTWTMEECPKGCDEEKKACITDTDAEEACDAEGVTECVNGMLKTCENKTWTMKKCPNGCDELGMKCAASEACAEGEIKCVSQDTNGKAYYKCQNGAWDTAKTEECEDESYCISASQDTLNAKNKDRCDTCKSDSHTYFCEEQGNAIIQQCEGKESGSPITISRTQCENSAYCDPISISCVDDCSICHSRCLDNGDFQICEPHAQLSGVGSWRTLAKCGSRNECNENNKNNNDDVLGCNCNLGVKTTDAVCTSMEYVGENTADNSSKNCLFTYKYYKKSSDRNKCRSDKGEGEISCKRNTNSIYYSIGCNIPPDEFHQYDYCDRERSCSEDYNACVIKNSWSFTCSNNAVVSYVSGELKYRSCDKLACKRLLSDTYSCSGLEGERCSSDGTLIQKWKKLKWETEEDCSLDGKVCMLDEEGSPKCATRECVDLETICDGQKILICFNNQFKTTLGVCNGSTKCYSENSDEVGARMAYCLDQSNALNDSKR